MSKNASTWLKWLLTGVATVLLSSVSVVYTAGQKSAELSDVKTDLHEVKVNIEEMNTRLSRIEGAISQSNEVVSHRVTVQIPR